MKLITEIIGAYFVLAGWLIYIWHSCFKKGSGNG
jgi:hypothetical protein